MKRIVASVCIMASVVCVALCASNGVAKEPLVGGFSKASVSEKEVVDAAAFAVKAEAKAMQESKESLPVKLELVKIVSAEQQVVAGMNYRLKLKVKLNGQEKVADVVVWWQAWRTPDPYQLTSWEWKE